MAEHPPTAPLAHAGEESSSAVEQQYNENDTGHREVKELLNSCRLSQYLELFIAEGFDSLVSLCEISEDDMIAMKVKRGHRRLIQREIATAKGIPRNQPLWITTVATSSATGSAIPPQTGYDVFTLGANPRTVRRFYLGKNGSDGSSSSSSASGRSGRSTDFNSGRHRSSSMSAFSSNTGGITSVSYISPPMDQPGERALLHKTQVSAAKLSNKDSDTSIDDDDEDEEEEEEDDSGGSTFRRGSASVTLMPPKRPYRRHPKPDKNAPVKPPSAYIMFSNDVRVQLKDQNLTFTQLAKIVGDKWKSLGNAEKQKYEKAAAIAKNEYLVALNLYRHTPEYKKYQDYLKDFKAKQLAARRSADTSIRKRSKTGSPDSGSLADSSSNGNSNGVSSSSGSSGSADGYDNGGNDTEDPQAGGQSMKGTSKTTSNDRCKAKAEQEANREKEREIMSATKLNAEDDFQRVVRGSFEIQSASSSNTKDGECESDCYGRADVSSHIVASCSTPTSPSLSSNSSSSRQQEVNNPPSEDHRPHSEPVKSSIDQCHTENPRSPSPDRLLRQLLSPSGSFDPIVVEPLLRTSCHNDDNASSGTDPPWTPSLSATKDEDQQGNFSERPPSTRPVSPGSASAVEAADHPEKRSRH